MGTSTMFVRLVSFPRITEVCGGFEESKLGAEYTEGKEYRKFNDQKLNWVTGTTWVCIRPLKL